MALCALDPTAASFAKRRLRSASAHDRSSFAKGSPRAGADGPEDYDVMSTHDGLVIGRIIRATTAPEGAPWLWTISTGERHDYGYEPTREAATAAFAKSWRRE